MLRHLDDSPAVTAPELLVGIGGADDAGVIRITPDTAIVQTVDFFTPIVDDPFDWGRVAAANALSDVYAMGAAPLSALQLVGWPRQTIPFDVLGRVMEGGTSVLAAAGCVLVGGHSVDDPEPKYGFAVTGLVHPDRLLHNSSGRPGDALVLTKPLGTGLIATGLKRGVAGPAQVRAAVDVMTTLNDSAAEAALEAGATAATDVTGFGLLGHLSEMLGGRLGAAVDFASVPVLDGARALAADGVVPGGTRRNLRHVEGFTHFGALDEPDRILLADAQTSGGLLIAVAAGRAADLVAGLGERGGEGVVIGELTEGSGRIVVRSS